MHSLHFWGAETVPPTHASAVNFQFFIISVELANVDLLMLAQEIVTHVLGKCYLLIKQGSKFDISAKSNVFKTLPLHWTCILILIFLSLQWNLQVWKCCCLYRDFWQMCQVSVACRDGSSPDSARKKARLEGVLEDSDSARAIFVGLEADS